MDAKTVPTRLSCALACVLSFLGLALVATRAQARELRIATGEFPPFATAARSDQGVALAIVRRAFELGGHSVQYTFLPWSRAQVETEAGLWDASAHWGASRERRERFLLSDNLLSEDWVLLHRADTRLTWQGVEDLAPYRIGITRDYTYTPELWAAVHSRQLARVDYVINDLAGLRVLLARRIDVLPLERNVACDLLTANFTAAQAAEVRAHPKPLNDQFTTHVLFPRGKPASPSLLADFNRGLKQLRASKEYAQLLQSVKCPGTLKASVPL